VTLRLGDSSQLAWTKALDKAVKELDRGNLVGLTVASAAPEVDEFIGLLRARLSAPILPVYCDAGDAAGSNHRTGGVQGVRVVLGEPLLPGAPVEEVRNSIRALRDGLQ
jgi:hypothetical protein